MSDAKISALTSLTGATVDATADVVPIVDTSITTSKKITVDELLLGMLASTTNARLKIGSFTRDISTAGSQAVTGVGFKPKAVIFLQCGSAAWSSPSIGFDNVTSAMCLSYQGGIVSTQWVNYTNRSIFVANNGISDYSGLLASLDSDGFTITWTRTGTTIGGTTTLIYLAIR